MLVGTTLSFSTLAYLMLFINVPSTIFGTHQGLMGEKLSSPTKQNRVKRDVVERVSKLRVMAIFGLSGLVPFVALSVQIA